MRMGMTTTSQKKGFCFVLVLLSTHAKTLSGLMNAGFFSRNCNDKLGLGVYKGLHFPQGRVS